MPECAICGATYTRNSPRQKYCSITCSNVALDRSVKKQMDRRKANKVILNSTCNICAVTYVAKTSRQKYCGKDCAQKGLQLAIERQTNRRCIKVAVKKRELAKLISCSECGKNTTEGCTCRI